MLPIIGVCRVGPSSFNQNVLSTTAQPRRLMANVIQKKSQNSANFRMKNIQSIQGINSPKEKALGAFKPFPPASLPHELCKRDPSKALHLPAFSVARENVGKAVMFNLPEHDPVRIFGVPKTMLLEFRLLSKPCSVIRDVSVRAIERLNQAVEKSSSETRLVLNGSIGCGKSFLLLQAVEHCVANGWIVIYIPRAVNLVNSTTTYEYDLRTRTFLQPKFSYQTLQRIRTVNMTALTKLTTTKKLVLEKREVALGTTLADLIGVALKEPPLSSVILEALVAELSSQTRHPVLFAVDDFQALYCRTAYRDPHFIPIRPYHLSIPRLIMEYASGKRSFAKGAFMGAITNSDTTYKLGLELRDALGISYEHAVSPYDKRSSSLMEYTQGLKSLQVPDQLSTQEAASLFEVWMKDDALVPSMYDESFLAKYTESGGNAREFVWKGILASLEL